jgi:hypothetical protein
MLIGAAALGSVVGCHPKQDAEACANQQRKSPHTRELHHPQAPGPFPPWARKLLIQ